MYITNFDDMTIFSKSAPALRIEFLLTQIQGRSLEKVVGKATMLEGNCITL